MPHEQLLDVTLYVATHDIGQEGNPKWVAFEGQTGLFGFGSTEAGARTRLLRGAEFTLDTLHDLGGRESVVEYLNRHNVEWSEATATPRVAVLSMVPSNEPVLNYAG